MHAAAALSVSFIKRGEEEVDNSLVLVSARRFALRAGDMVAGCGALGHPHV